MKRCPRDKPASHSSPEFSQVGDQGVSLQAQFLSLSCEKCKDLFDCVFQYFYGVLSLPLEQYPLSTLNTDLSCWACECAVPSYVCMHVHTHVHKDLFFLSFAELLFLQLTAEAIE